MIVVNLNKSYPPIASELAQLDDSQRTLAALKGSGLPNATLGDWYRLSDARIAADGDLIAGTYAGLVVSIFSIASWTQNKDGTVRFKGRPAPLWAPLIGRPQPGGPWKRGEARGTRYVPTAALKQLTNNEGTIHDWRQAIFDLAKQLTTDARSTHEDQAIEQLVSTTWIDGRLQIVVPEEIPHEIILRAATAAEKITAALAILQIPETPHNRSTLERLVINK